MKHNRLHCKYGKTDMSKLKQQVAMTNKIITVNKKYKYGKILHTINTNTESHEVA